MDDRCIAETCYQLGVAYTYQGQYDDAVKCYKDAACTIESRMSKFGTGVVTFGFRAIPLKCMRRGGGPEMV